jgi:hypothetical protein
MTDAKPRKGNTAKAVKAPPGSETSGASAKRQVRLPGFLVEEEIGLGDVIKKATASAGLKPCSGCNKRAAKFNRWVSFRPR